MTQAAAAKKDTQKLQRAIVDGLEDVKGQDIQVFNTEHLSPLFERVIVASGNSNRQTRALASSVVDAVRKAGFPKPRIEGEEVGEWIIVDCGAAVAHIMQPAIRQYYHLEEIWGEKPVRLRLGAPKPAQPAARKAAAKPASTEPSLRRSSAAKTAARAAEREAAAPAKKTAAKGGARSAAKTSASKSAAKTSVKKAPGQRTAARQAAAKKTASPRLPAGKTPGQGAAARTAARKIAPAKKTSRKA